MKKGNKNGQLPLVPPRRALLIILSGPSGVGKDAVLCRMKQSSLKIEYITTVTTRAQRTGEKDLVDYRFVPVEKFKEMIKQQELLEWAKVYGNWYGVPKNPIKDALEQGKDAIVKVDVQGAATIKKIVPEAVFIFLLPSSREELASRLKQRQTESSTDMALRLKTVEEEIKQLPMFDYTVINRQGELEQAVSDIQAIITAEKCRVNPRQLSL